MLFRALLLLFAVGCTHSEVVYTNLTGGGPAGEMVSRRLADGRRVVAFAYNDRGRGVQLSSTMDVNERSILHAIETRGVNYLKVPVAESFRGSGDAFYSSVNTVPEEYGLLANALLRRADRKLPLKPDGEAALLDAGELAVDGKRLRLYFITGIDLLPLGVWLDESNEFFGTSGPTLVYTEIRTIRKGWEALVPRLRAFEEEARLRTEREIAKAVTHLPRAPVVFAGVTVFDSRTATSVAHRNVIVEGNRIISVAPATSESPRDAMIIRGDGRTLIPGLCDVHAHNADEHGTSLNGLYQILCGVTSIRDLGGGSPEQMVAFRRAYDAGELVGPRVVLSGMLDSPGPYQGPTPVLVDTVDEVRATIDRYAVQGFEQIKFYSSFRPELITPAIEHARSKGLPVTDTCPRRRRRARSWRRDSPAFITSTSSFSTSGRK